jgi:hypothetical protein
MSLCGLDKSGEPTAGGQHGYGKKATQRQAT